MVPEHCLTRSVYELLNIRTTLHGSRVSRMRAQWLRPNNSLAGGELGAAAVHPRASEFLPSEERVHARPVPHAVHNSADKAVASVPAVV
jgi:hypothetical protein